MFAPVEIPVKYVKEKAFINDLWKEPRALQAIIDSDTKVVLDLVFGRLHLLSYFTCSDPDTRS